jgi:methylenetetrahydrofolate--tRNA-(uracil-5-)-methyltransferase
MSAIGYKWIYKSHPESIRFHQERRSRHDQREGPPTGKGESGKRIFTTIPGLEGAEFARLGGLHRNTFLNAPKLLDSTLRLKAEPRLRFAGQITGCEGYVESAAIGLLTGRFAAAERAGRTPSPPPPTTAMGAILGHITGGAEAETFQPMNVNFGLFPPIEAVDERGKRLRGRKRKQAMSTRALKDFEAWLAETAKAAA